MWFLNVFARKLCYEGMKKRTFKKCRHTYDYEKDSRFIQNGIEKKVNVLPSFYLFSVVPHTVTAPHFSPIYMPQKLYSGPLKT